MTRTWTITLSALMLSALAAGDAAAQWNVARFGASRNRVYTTFGVDPAMVSATGYGRVVTVRGHDFQLTADAGVVGGQVDAHDFRARVGTQTSLARWRSVHLTGSATFLTRGTENSVYRAINFGADVTGSVGVYRPRWFAAGEFGKDKAIVTRLRHSDWYRSNHYAGARDGWYVDGGGTFHYGLSSGLAIGPAELSGRFGWRRTERFEPVTPPVYAGMGIGFGF